MKEDATKQAQAYQQQMQSIIIQKESLNLQLLEIKKALEELEKIGNGEVFKLAGPLLVKTTVESAKKDLKEKEEMLTLRIGNLEKIEKQIKERIEKLKHS
ncbi:MAG: prefoldin subunit beta [Candidatus Aenigmatarchaeota archaeon]